MIELRDYGDFEAASSEVFSRLVAQDSTLTDLSVRLDAFASEGDMGWPVEIGRAIGMTTRMKMLNLSLSPYTRHYSPLLKEAAFLLLRAFNDNYSVGNTVDSLMLTLHQEIGDDFIRLLTPLLKKSNMRITLEGDVTTAQFGIMGEILANREYPLPWIDLGVLRDNDAGAIAFFGAFHENPGKSPIVISLYKNNIGKAGCEAIAKLLKKEACSMKVLNLSFNPRIGNDEAKKLADALTTNNTLRDLNLDGTGVTSSGLRDIFLPLLCNHKSIDGIYKSNHTLQSLGLRNPEIEQYLQWNLLWSNKKIAALIKVLTNVDNFATLDPSLFGHVAALFDKARRNGIAYTLPKPIEEILCSFFYHALRRNPSLLIGEEPKQLLPSKSAAGGKRKRDE